VTWLNYHHLYYFWVVAREGTISAACKELRLAQPTVSTQLRALEQTLGQPLFDRRGRNLVLTDAGNRAYRYANEIFSLGEELVDTFEGHPMEGRTRLRVGIADVLSKQVAHALLAPALQGEEPVTLVCHEGKPAPLLSQLSVYELDLVLSDSPIPPDVKLKGFNHLLGESTIAIYGAKRLAAKYRRGFPESLDGAPMLLPTGNTSIRRSLDQWFASKGVRPVVVAEFEDSALMKVFGQAGAGIYPIPSIIEKESQRLYGGGVIGQISALRVQYYAISVERRLTHPGVVAFINAAQRDLFGKEAEQAEGK